MTNIPLQKLMIKREERSSMALQTRTRRMADQSLPSFEALPAKQVKQFGKQGKNRRCGEAADTHRIEVDGGETFPGVPASKRATSGM